MTFEVLVDGRLHQIDAPSLSSDSAPGSLAVNGEPHHADIAQVEPGVFSILIGDRSFEATLDGATCVWVNSARFEVALRDPRQWSQGRSVDSEHGLMTLTAAMPGKVVEVLAGPGDELETGQGVLVVEAMKMQNEVKSPRAGVVQAVRVAVGDSVAAGQALATVE